MLVHLYEASCRAAVVEKQCTVAWCKWCQAAFCGQLVSPPHQGHAQLKHVFVILEIDLIDGDIVQAEHAQSKIFGGRKLETQWMSKHVVEKAVLPVSFTPAFKK